MLKKLVMGVLKLTVKYLKHIGLTLNDIMVEVTVIMVNEANMLDNMTIAELRNFAKANGISLEGKRVREDIINVIKKNLEV